MPFCPDCRSEYREGFQECADCKVALVADLPPGPKMPEEDTMLVNVYGTTLLEEAAILRVMLRDHGIESNLGNKGGAMYAVGMPTSAAPVKILVRTQDAEKAARLIKEYYESKKKNE